MSRRQITRQGGTSLVEVLLSVLILSIGLLGLAGLQGRAHQAELESYQRAQALTLLAELADRIAANRGNAAAYLAGGTYGHGSTVTDCSGFAATEVAERDLCEWDLALRGAATNVGGVQIGNLTLVRGCISAVTTGTATGSGTLVEVAWYGSSPGDAPPSDLTCGSGLGPENQRRVVSQVVELANLGT